MKKLAMCFTANGRKIIERINEESIKYGISPCTGYICGRSADPSGGFEFVDTSVAEWTADVFLQGNALIYIGAVGIAVRALSSLPKDKLTDCPVIVIDDNGQFVIPVLSGHAGGANKLAVMLAQLLGAVPVITTSTDVNDAFSVDTFAVENRLSISKREGIRQVSVKALENKKVTLSVKDYPPKERVDVIVADETDFEYSILLKPKKYTVGIGMKKNTDPETLEAFLLECLGKAGITVDDVYAFCTIDIKEDEKALTALRDKYRIPVISFEASILGRAEGEFSSSAFVYSTVGVDNVCERAAVTGGGSGSELVLKKQTGGGITVAVAKRTGSAF